MGCASDWPSFLKRLVTAIVLGLMLVFWIVFLAGAAAATDRCKKLRSSNPNAEGWLEDSDGYLVLYQMDLAPLSNSQSQPDQCQEYFSLTWFLVVFQIVVMGIAVLSTVIPPVRYFLGQTLTPFFAVLCAVMITVTHQFHFLEHKLENGIYVINQYASGATGKTTLQFANDARDKVHKFKESLEVAEAGMAALVVVNAVYMIMLMAGHGSLTPALVMGKDDKHFTSATAPAPAAAAPAGAVPAAPPVHVGGHPGGVAIVDMGAPHKPTNVMPAPPPPGPNSNFGPPPQPTGGYPPQTTDSYLPQGQVVTTTPYNPAVPPTAATYPPNGPPHAAYPSM